MGKPPSFCRIIAVEYPMWVILFIPTTIGIVCVS